MRPRQSPEELFEQQTKTVEATKKKPVIIRPTPLPPIEPLERDKVEILGRGLVYVIWINTLLFSGVLILIAVLYPFPMNMIIISFAVVMDFIALFTTRKYIK